MSMLENCYKNSVIHYERDIKLNIGLIFFWCSLYTTAVYSLDGLAFKGAGLFCALGLLLTSSRFLLTHFGSFRDKHLAFFQKQVLMNFSAGFSLVIVHFCILWMN